MFIEAKSWKELEILTMKYYSAGKGKKNSDLWINLDDILLNETSQTQKE